MVNKQVMADLLSVESTTYPLTHILCRASPARGSRRKTTGGAAWPVVAIREGTSADANQQQHQHEWASVSELQSLRS